MGTPGTVICLRDLKAKSLNGRFGRCEKFIEEKNRWQIFVFELMEPANRKLIKELNLEIVQEPVVVTKVTDGFRFFFTLFAPDFLKNRTAVLMTDNLTQLNISSTNKNPITWKKNKHLTETLRLLFQAVYKQREFLALRCVESRISLNLQEAKKFKDYLDLIEPILNDDEALSALGDYTGTILYHKGMCLEPLGLSDLQCYQKAIDLMSDSSSNAYMKSICLNAMGYYYRARGKNEKAVHYYEQAFDLQPDPKVKKSIKQNLNTAKGAITLLQFGVETPTPKIKKDHCERYKEEEPDMNPYDAKNFDICANCEAAWDQTKRKMSICSRCRTTLYCSKVCQEKDWEAHKKICKEKK